MDDSLLTRETRDRETRENRVTDLKLADFFPLMSLQPQDGCLVFCRKRETGYFYIITTRIQPQPCTVN